MAWQVGVAQTVPLICYLDGVPTVPTTPIETKVNVAGAGFVAATNGAVDRGYGAVSVALTGAEVGAWGFVRVVGANGAVGIAPYTAEGDWTVARAETIDTLPTAAEVNALLSAEHGAGLWGGAAGTGAFTVTLTLSDGAGRLAGGLAVAVRDSAGNTVAGPLATNTSGRVTYYLDAGDYAVVTPSTTMWQGSSTPLAVTGDAVVNITLTTQVLPVPSAPDKFVIIVNAADEFGDLVGAEAWRIRITDVWPRGLPGVDLVQLTRQAPITLDANGQATFEIAKETTAFALSITPQLAAGADGATEIIRVTVDPTVANEYDQIYLADLLTE